MSGRRNGNRIRGPQSALTDFLAANNISAQQIRDEYERRRRGEPANDDDQVDSEVEQLDTDTLAVAAAVAAEVEEDEEAVKQTKKRKRVQVEVEQKIKRSKKASSSGKKGGKKASSDFEDEEDEEFVRDMYKKSRPAPGQFAHCENCNKRFTVTPYTKEGPEGGLMCTPCGKQMAKDLNKEKKAAAKPVVRKRRKLESDKLDGFANRGSKSLQQICIEKVVQNHGEVEELGDLPQNLLERLSAIFSKSRVLKPNTLPLFLRPDLNEVVLHDAAYLEVSDYKQIFAVVPTIQKLALGNACQFKDEAIDYMVERCKQLKDIRLYAPNLVTNAMWSKLVKSIGSQLETIKLKWLDAAFEDENVAEMVTYCQNLKRLKLKFCRRIGEPAIAAIAESKSVQHLSLLMNKSVQASVLVDLIKTIGPQLRTLSLEKFLDADDSVLQAIHESCTKLSKLRFSENDTASDAAFAALFTKWPNQSLTFVDMNCTRDVDNNDPDGPEEAIGFASQGFRALMAHSGSTLKHLDIASCRHIELAAFLDVFNGDRQYPLLDFINISFCTRVDTTVIAGIFKSCPGLKKLVAFGCFDIGEVVVPRDIILIGIPKAQDAVEQFGVGIDVDEALGRMIEVGA